MKWGVGELGVVGLLLLGAGASAQETDLVKPPISVDFQNADVLAVIRAFADFSGESVVVGSGVAGQVTASVSNLPWDEALRVILEAQGLILRVDRGVYRVESSSQVSEARKVEELEARLFPLGYLTAGNVAQTIGPLLSDRGKVQADSASNALLVKDTPAKLNEIQDLLSHLDVETRQVVIKAKILFVDKDKLREFGLRFVGGNVENTLTDVQGEIALGRRSADPFLLAQLGIADPALTVGGLLGALETQQLADVLAEPQVAVLNNLEAEIFVGERTPLRVVDVGADQQVGAPRATARLVETGIRLTVTPHITLDERVLLDLRAERSGVVLAATDAGVQFQTQQAQSRLLVSDGETAVIGGLTVRDRTQSRSGVPLLMDVPLLGSLFSFSRSRTIQRDLLIFVTPYIVPMGAVPGPASSVGTPGSPLPGSPGRSGRVGQKPAAAGACRSGSSPCRVPAHPR